MCALSATLTDENQLKTCRELGLKQQDFEHLENCNTWDKDRCPRLVNIQSYLKKPKYVYLNIIVVHKDYRLVKRSIIICSACVGYNCPKYALCRDVSTYEDPYATCECQLGRIMSSEGIQFQMIYCLYMINICKYH